MRDTNETSRGGFEESLEQVFGSVEDELEGAFEETPEGAWAEEAAPEESATEAGITSPAIFLPGLFLTGLGVVLGLMHGASGWAGRVAEVLQRFGFEPSSLVLAGLVLGFLAFLMDLRRLGTAALEARVAVLSEDLEARIEEVMKSVKASFEDAKPVDQEQLATGLRKLENMTANLNKAMRLFNKPLVEAVARLNDLAQEVDGIREDVRAVEKAAAENLVSSEKKWEGLVERLRADTEELEGSIARLQEEIVGELKPFIEEKANHAAVKMGTKLDEDRREWLGRLEERLAALREGVESAGRTPPEIDLSPVRNALQEVLSELRSRPAVAAGPTPAAEAPAAPPAPAAAPSAVAGEPAEAGGRTVRVLSAIEKLKRMRGG